MAVFVKDPDATKDYTVDFTNWLQSGESISTVAWTVPTGLTQVSVQNTTTDATIYLSGGTVRAVYEVVCQITTDSSPTARVEQRSVTIRVEEQ